MKSSYKICVHIGSNEENTAMCPFISVRNLAKSFESKNKGSIEALKDVSFDVDKGEFLCIVGPSGCGKSTLLKLITGLLKPEKGSISIDDVPVTGPTRKIGMVFQQPNLLDWRTVLKNILLSVEILKLDQKMYYEKALKLIELVGLKEFKDKYPFELSGGMQQRVAICRALIHDPHLLVMDEPFGALDALTREKMNLEILYIWRRTKKTAIFVTHNIEEAVFLGGRILILTHRPAKVHKTVKVDLRRPRKLEILSDERFVKLRKIVYEAVAQ